MDYWLLVIESLRIITMRSQLSTINYQLIKRAESQNVTYYLVMLSL